MKEGFSTTALRVFRSLIGVDKSSTTEDELSAPISIRVPKSLLAEIDAQSDSISGRYRSRHINNLLHLGANYFRAQDAALRNLDPQHFGEVSRLNYIFDKHDLNVAQVSQDLGFNSSEVLSGYLTGRVRPEFPVLDLLAKKLMINAEWLKTGIDQNGDDTAGNMILKPYLVRNAYFYRDLDKVAHEILSYQDLKIHTLRVLRNGKGEVLLNLDYSDNRFASIYYNALCIKDMNSIGRSGETDLALFAILMRFMSKELNEFNVASFTLSDEHFELIKSGQANPKDLGLSIHTSSDWVSALWSQQVAANATSNDLWLGALELFKYIQHSRDYEFYLNQLISEEAVKYAQLRNEYNDKYRH